jgi:anti-sigma B factor antagonist
MDRIKISERQVDGITIVELEGRLIFEEGDAALGECITRLVRNGFTRIVIDMKKVTRIDSAGIGMLVAKYVTAYTRGGRLKLLNLTNRGEALMGVTNLTTVFDIFDSEDEAIRSFSLAESMQRRPPGL